MLTSSAIANLGVAAPLATDGFHAQIDRALQCAGLEREWHCLRGGLIRRVDPQPRGCAPVARGGREVRRLHDPKRGTCGGAVRETHGPRCGGIPRRCAPEYVAAK